MPKPPKWRLKSLFCEKFIVIKRKSINYVLNTIQNTLQVNVAKI
jgi:hypothetical protein